jgi:diguanylate cyclase (GGDEF)-like protein
MKHPQTMQFVDWRWAMTLLRWALLAAWTVLIGASLAWNVVLHNQTIEDQARIIARTAFEKDVLYRRWNNGYGGVYVWITPNSQPNPYLDVPERDLTTTGGQQLTMINPAYMTRQVFELQRADMGVIGHITSLKPIRPLNQADAWETSALQAFERGETESSVMVEVDGHPLLRLMRPLMVEEKCLKCHAKQGYTVGQVRGGISEAVPLTPLRAAGQNALITLVMAHAGIWLVGLIGIWGSVYFLQRSLHKQRSAEQKLLEMSTHDRLTGLYNRTYFEEVFQDLEEIKSGPVSIFMADVDNLKRVNDEQGHPAGDMLIQRAAEVFRDSFRVEDTVARIGGDEFVIILPKTDAVQAAAILQRVQLNLAQHNIHYPNELLDFSIGIATTAPGDTLQNTFKLADQRMYENKRKKKQGITKP